MQTVTKGWISVTVWSSTNNWSGSIVYPRIYKFDGNSWTYHDSIPDNNLWDVETVLVGNDVYLVSGWLSGPHLLRKYNFITLDWTYLASSNNTQTWGVASRYGSPAMARARACRRTRFDAASTSGATS